MSDVPPDRAPDLAEPHVDEHAGAWSAHTTFRPRRLRRIRPAPPPRPDLRHIVAFSLLATTFAAIVALIVHYGFDGSFLVPFIVLRWCVVFTLCGTVAIAWLLPRLPLPGVLRTPLTPLLLTCESIAIDILGAQLH